MENLSNSPNTLRSLLRAHVWPLHQRLDQSPTLQALTRPDLDAPSYSRVLGRFRTAYQHIEPNVAALERVVKHDIGQAAIPAYQPRLPSLKNEHALFSRSEPSDPVASTLLPPLPEVRCPLSTYLGSRYVLEGASQGTPHVLRALQHHHPEWPLHPEGYWHTLLAQVPAWRQLCLLLDTPQNHKPVTLSELQQGATWVFESFIASLSPPAH